ncbi:MAG: amino acid permease [Verrucomicrobiae bacterium]|nr:amino acid permease [Verrucomicrobiae bacterium]
MRSFWHSCIRRKPLDQLVAETNDPSYRLKRSLGAVELTALGIGAIVGAGIFSTVGTAAAGGAEHVGAGPALAVSFVLVAVACGFAALCYAEFAAMAPVSGSAYTYAYATLGELVAWIIGWDLILEYAVGNVAVAISWSAYFQELLRGFGVDWPAWLGTDLRSAMQAAARLAQAKAESGGLATLGGALLRDAAALETAPRVLGVPIIFNLPALLIVAVVTWVLVIGIRESATFNAVMVILKLAVVALFLVVGAFYVRPENWRPFAPNGWQGIWSAAAIIFFAYIGFDAISTAAEEARNPQRDMPIGIVASLVICTVLYVAVAVVLTGMANWRLLGTAEPLASAFAPFKLRWVPGIIALGALVANTSVLVAFQLGQPRIFFSMARDGLLPSWAARVHPRYRTPHVTTIITGIFVGVFASVTNINEMVELTNIGTLFAFFLVAAGIIVLRITRPDWPRPFRTPFVPVVPLLAMGSCGLLMAALPRITWIRFCVWLAVGLAIYLSFGMWESKLNRSRDSLARG